MQMPKPTETDKARFRDLVPDDPRVEVKPMFGNLGAFVNGNMFMGLFGADIGLKLATSRRRRAARRSRAPARSARPSGRWAATSTIPPTMIGHRRGPIVGRTGSRPRRGASRRRPPAKTAKPAMSSRSAKK